jgi:hypothetical protein
LKDKAWRYDMQTETNKTLEVLAKEFSLSKDVIIKEGLKIFLERKLREIKTEIFRITGQYKITSVEEFEELYKRGDIEEKDSWSDYQKLDHLEFKKDEIEKLLQEFK